MKTATTAISKAGIGWIQVKLENGQIGWTHPDNIKINGKPFYQIINELKKENADLKDDVIKHKEELEKLMKESTAQFTKNSVLVEEYKRKVQELIENVEKLSTFDSD